jgi:hypothetical protein
MWPDSPNEFTYNLLCGTKRCTRETCMALPCKARKPSRFQGAHSLVPVGCQLSPPFVLLKTPDLKVPTYSKRESVGSIAKPRTLMSGRPELIGFQLRNHVGALKEPFEFCFCVDDIGVEGIEQDPTEPPRRESGAHHRPRFSEVEALEDSGG